MVLSFFLISQNSTHIVKVKEYIQFKNGNYSIKAQLENLDIVTLKENFLWQRYVIGQQIYVSKKGSAYYPYFNKVTIPPFCFFLIGISLLIAILYLFFSKRKIVEWKYWFCIFSIFSLILLFHMQYQFYLYDNPKNLTEKIQGKIINIIKFNKKNYIKYSYKIDEISHIAISDMIVGNYKNGDTVNVIYSSDNNSLSKLHIKTYGFLYSLSSIIFINLFWITIFLLLYFFISRLQIFVQKRKIIPLAI